MREQRGTDCVVREMIDVIYLYLGMVAWRTIGTRF